MSEINPIDHDHEDNYDTGTRFKPPPDTNNKAVRIIGEGYRLTDTDISKPFISVSNNKEVLHERLRRDVALGNSSTFDTSSTSTASVKLSNNVADDEQILSDADANSWANNLSLMSAADGSGETFESKLLLNVLT